MNCSVILNKTFTHIIENCNFGNLPKEQIYKILKDGRPFSHFIENWIGENYPLTHIKETVEEKNNHKKFQVRLINFIEDRIEATKKKLYLN